jgi:uncharacterized membrane protein YqgA involved in biofilm formation
MEISVIVIGVVVAIIIFFLLREFFSWYYKINQIVKLLEKNNELLEKIIEKKSVASVLLKVSDEDLLIEDLKKNLKDDEAIVKIKFNGKIEKRKISDIEDSTKEGKSDRFSVIYKK